MFVARKVFSSSSAGLSGILTLRAMSVSTRTVVELTYSDLVAGKDLSAEIKQAYGPDGLGILTVSGVPGYMEKRKALLPLAQRVANMTDEQKQALVHEKSTYSFGWSHGKEHFNGLPDLMKGSYYANPQFDNPTGDDALIAQFPEYCHPNIWPADDVLPELAPAFKDLGSLMVDVGILVAKQCDNYVASVSPAFPRGRISGVISSSLACKARLLHYFPPSPEEQDGESTWCGWHNDHGSLTGLTSAMFTDRELRELSSPDPEAGLYIRDRSGEQTRINIPPASIGFQIGETSQVMSGGELQATPHYVQGPQPSLSQGVARNTFAVFMQPTWSEAVASPEGVSAEKVAVGQWRPGMDFIGFTKATLSEYY